MMEPAVSPTPAPSSDEAGQPIGMKQSLEVQARHIPAGKNAQQPVPPDRQSAASDLPPALRRYDPPNYAIVRPQEPPVQPPPVTLSVSSNAGVESFSPITGSTQPEIPEPDTRKRTGRRRPAARPRGAQRGQVTITNRAEVIRYTTVLIIALEEVLE